MAQRGRVKNKFDFIVSCRSLKEMRWIKAQVLNLKRAWTRRRS